MYQLTHCLTLDAIRAIVDSDTDLAQTIVTRHKEIEEKSDDYVKPTLSA